MRHDADALTIFMSFVLETTKENKEFLEKHAKNILEESLCLINDAIDYLGLFIKGGTEKVIKSPIAFYVFHILEPVSYSIFINLLLGNVPVCFRDLRFLVESLAKCYLAEVKYSDKVFFKEKLDKLMSEENKRGRRKREYEFVKEFDELIGSRAIRLWGKLSEEAHTQKYLDRVFKAVTIRSTIPPYALGVPMKYYESDLDDLNDLYNYIREFREMLKKAIGYILLKDLVERYKAAIEFWVTCDGSEIASKTMEQLKEELRIELSEMEDKLGDIPLEYLKALTCEISFQCYNIAERLKELFEQALSELVMS